MDFLKRKGLAEGQRRYGLDNMACPICRQEEGSALVSHLKKDHGMGDQDASVVAKDMETRTNANLGYEYPVDTATGPKGSGISQKFYEPKRDMGDYAKCSCGHEKALHTNRGGGCYSCACQGMTNA